MALNLSPQDRNAIAQLLAQQPDSQFVQNDQGTTTLFKPNGGGIDYALSGMQEPPPGPKQKPVKLYGVNDGGMVMDMGFDDLGNVRPDYSRGQIDIPGVGKGFYSKDGRYAVGTDANGNPFKAVLGYDPRASMQWTAQNLGIQKTRADIEHTQKETEQLGQGHWSITPDGEYKINSQTGELKPLMVAGDAQGIGQGPNQAPAQVPISVSKEAQQKRLAGYQAGLKELSQDDKELDSARAIAPELQNWAALQPKVATGRLAGYIPAIGNPDRQELLRIENFLAMNNFKPGQGSMSNFERSLIKGAGPSVHNDPEANMDIVKVMLGAKQTLQDRQAFRQAYLQTNGNLLGADQAWQSYIEANPATVRDNNSGRMIDNPNRTSWSQYIPGAKSSGGLSQAQPEASSGRQELQAPPPASKYPGKMMTTPQGVRYISDGTNWVRQ